jgi:SPP1 gp7 family putative phage head morphogenesis protein
MTPELKNIINDTLKRISDLIKITLPFAVVRNHIMREFVRGWDEIESQADMNLQPSFKPVDFLLDYTFDNIKGMNEEIAEKIRKELSQAFLNRESVEQMKQRVLDVVDVSIARAQTIARTELYRAYNMGREEAAKKAGFSKKYLIVTEDERTSDICGSLDAKYGSVDKAIAFDAPFVTHTKYADINQQLPTFHPNCRTRVAYLE